MAVQLIIRNNVVTGFLLSINWMGMVNRGFHRRSYGNGRLSIQQFVKYGLYEKVISVILIIISVV